MNANKKIIKKLVYGSLNKIYSASLSVSKTYIYELIPLTVLREVINKAHLNNDAGLPIEFVNSYNNMIDVLYNTCALDATPSGLILPVILRHHIAVAKTSFSASLQ